MKSRDLYYRPKLTFWLGDDLRRRRQIRDTYTYIYVCIYIYVYAYIYGNIYIIHIGEDLPAEIPSISGVDSRLDRAAFVDQNDSLTSIYIYIYIDR